MLRRRSWSRLAGCRRIRVLNHELCAFEVFFVVDLGTDEILIAHGVDQEGDSVSDHHSVVFVGGFIKSEAVLETGASSALNEYSEFEIRVAFLVNQFFNFEAGGIGEDNGSGSMICS